MEAPYFDNHRRVRRFPWSLYHAPLEAELSAFLAALVRCQSAPSKVLVIGCGLLQELDRAPSALELTAVDVDPRAVASARALADRRLVRAEVVAADEDLARLGPFDAVYAKEVIEHIPGYEAYLQGLRRALRPGGRLWLSTPNYGEPWLPALEFTFLEALARKDGFTRFGMHPAKFSRRRLEHALHAAGFVRLQVRPAALRLALVASAEAPLAT